jgi:GTPase SAR1 family protein
MRWQVLLGDMGTGKSSLVLRFVKGQFFEYQVGDRQIQKKCAMELRRIQKSISDRVTRAPFTSPAPSATLRLLPIWCLEAFAAKYIHITDVEL